MYQRGPKLEVNFRYTNFFLASNPPPPPRPPGKVTVVTKPWPGRHRGRKFETEGRGSMIWVKNIHNTLTEAEWIHPDQWIHVIWAIRRHRQGRK